MTGWQGNDGGQGNWNQPYGPDPHTNQYGTDPYANQYGPDPYGGGYEPTGQNDPYAAYPPPYPQYQTGGFPAQGYGPPPPPEPKRSKLPMILSIVAIVIIIGAVVAIVLVNRKDTQQTADPQPSTTEQSDPTAKTTTPSKVTPSSRAPSGEDDWISVDNSKDAGLRYQVPPDWKTSATPRASGLEVDFTGNAEYGLYDCEGGSYVRTFAASGDVQSPDGKDLDLEKTVTDFAKSFGTTYFGADATVEVPTPEKFEIDGKPAMKLTAKVKPQVTKPACQATEGEVALVGVLLETEGKPADVTMLVVVNDVAGGPDDPKPTPVSISQDILATVKVG